MEDSWYVVAVEPRAEQAVSARGDLLHIVTYYPTGKQLVRLRRGHRVTVDFRQTPAIAGYVFVQGAAHFGNFRRDFDGPEAVPHCLGWLSGSNGPEPVAADVVADMRQRAADGEFDQAESDGRYWAPRWVRNGVKVLMVAGEYKDQRGQIWRLLTEKRKVAIWLRRPGGVTLVECPLEWIARARIGR